MACRSSLGVQTEQLVKQLVNPKPKVERFASRQLRELRANHIHNFILFVAPQILLSWGSATFKNKKQLFKFSGAMKRNAAREHLEYDDSY